MSVACASTSVADKPSVTQVRPAKTVPTFFINRDCDGDRLVSIKSFLTAAALPAERVTGVEGLAIPPQFREFFFDGDALHSKLRAGEVGCYASHLVAMELVLQRDLDYALILEDDAAVPADINQILADVIAALPKGWDLVHLCKDTNRAIKTIAALPGKRRLIRYSRVPETTTGYLISRSGAQKFLKPLKRYWPIDTDFRQPWRFGLSIFGVTPCFIKPAGFDSAIHMMGNHSRLRRGFPMPTRHCWTGNPLHTPEGIIFNLRTLGPVTWTLCAAHNSARRVVHMLGLKPIARRLGITAFGVRLADSLAVR